MLCFSSANCFTTVKSAVDPLVFRQPRSSSFINPTVILTVFLSHFLYLLCWFSDAPSGGGLVVSVKANKFYLYLSAELSLVRFLLELVHSLQFYYHTNSLLFFPHTFNKTLKIQVYNLYKICHPFLPDYCRQHTQVQLHPPLFLLMWKRTCAVKQAFCFEISFQIFVFNWALAF